MYLRFCNVCKNNNLGPIDPLRRKKETLAVHTNGRNKFAMWPTHLVDSYKMVCFGEGNMELRGHENHAFVFPVNV